MLKKYAASLLLSLISFLINGQNLIGYSEAEIRKFMKENHKEMTCNEVKNSMFKYLKYSDDNDSQTLLFFLDNNSVCGNIKLVCDQSLKAQKIKELDSIYRKMGVNKWVDRRNGKKYNIELNDEKWAFSVTYKRNE
jgi:hypothetical protein